MDDGGVVPEHSHPHEQAGLVLVRAGCACSIERLNERDLEPGDAVPDSDRTWCIPAW